MGGARGGGKDIHFIEQTGAHKLNFDGVWFLLYLRKIDNLHKLQTVQHEHIHAVYTALNIKNAHLKFLLLHPSVGGKFQDQDVMHYTFVFNFHVRFFFFFSFPFLVVVFVT